MSERADQSTHDVRSNDSSSSRGQHGHDSALTANLGWVELKAVEEDQVEGTGSCQFPYHHQCH